jgi:hypothetical protein
MYGVCIGQTLSNLTRFIKNISNICFSKEIYYKNMIDDLSNDRYVSKIKNIDFSESEMTLTEGAQKR